LVGQKFIVVSEFFFDFKSVGFRFSSNRGFHRTAHEVVDF
jgi:hypothetical protein